MAKWLPLFGLAGILVFVFGAFLFGYTLGKKAEHLESIKAITAQKIASENHCQALQNITTGIDNGLQKNLDDINGRLISGVMRDNACIMPLAVNPASASPAGGPKHAGQNGIQTQWLRQYAAEAEIYRVKLAACQQMLIQERDQP